MRESGMRVTDILRALKSFNQRDNICLKHRHGHLKPVPCTICPGCVQHDKEIERFVLQNILEVGCSERYQENPLHILGSRIVRKMAELPSERGYYAYCVAACLIAFQILVATILINILIFLMAEFLWRCCILVEELKHVDTRYNGNTWLAVDNALVIRTWLTMFLVVLLCIALIYMMLVAINFEHQHLITWENGISLAACWIITRVFGMGNAGVMFQFGEKTRFLFPGIFMAYSYFDGFLSIVLPASGYPDSKSIRDRINQFVSFHQRTDEFKVYFPEKCLFKLISESCYSPQKLDETGIELDNGQRQIHHVQQLEAVQTNRGGVVGRGYWNVVYKIYFDREKHPLLSEHLVQILNVPAVFVVAEGATPLLTLYNIWEKHSQDVGNVDEDGSPVNVAEIILDRMEDIIRNKRASLGSTKGKR